MPIRLFRTQDQQPIDFETGSEAKDAILTGAANLAPDQEVYLKDLDGNISRALGKDAVGYIISPESTYSLATDEDIYLKNREARYGNPVQQGLAAVEGVVNSAGAGFGNALTKAAIGLATPGDKENKLAQKYGEAVKQRSAENPVASIGGEIGGLLADPLGVGALITKGASKVGAGAAKATALAAESRLTPKVIEKALKTKVVEKAVERGGAFAAEGGVWGANFEAGRQIVDGNPINGDAILSEGKNNALMGLGLGTVFGATEAAAAKTLKVVKEQTKKYLDKVTGASGDAKGEVFYPLSSNALNKEVAPAFGRNQKAIKLTEEPTGDIKYTDNRRESLINIPENATGLDLTNPQSVENLGTRMKITSLDDKINHLKPKEQPLSEFLAEQKHNQILENELRGVSRYMEAEDLDAYNRIRQVRESFKNLKNVTPDDVSILKQAVKQEEKLFNKYNPEYDQISPALKEKLFKQDLDDAKRALSEYDFIKDFGDDGKKNIFVFNEGILPSKVTVKNLGKGITPLEFEAGQMAKQYRMTPKAMQKMGNKRLNEVSDFIFNQYPQQGSVLKRATTSVDHILDNINDVKNKAINDLNDSIEQALNVTQVKQTITTEDIANQVDNILRQKYTDPISGNPMAGMERAYNQLQEFADGYRNNGFTDTNRYGVRNYKPLDVKELRKLRIDIDQIANFSKKEGSALEDIARDLRTWMEDEVVRRVGAFDPDLKAKYEAAKKAYGLSVDAEKIVDAAAKKASKDSKFSLFYSGIGAAAGGAVGGTPGAIVGGLAGGAVNNLIKEYSGNLSVFVGRDIAKNADKYERLIESTAKAFFKPVETATKTYMKMPKSNEDEIAKKDYDRLYNEVSDREGYVEKFIDANEFLFEQYPETGERMIQSMLRARDFLITKIPVNPYVGNPWKENTWKPSPYSIDKYMRYREAVNRPSVILEQIKNGYITPEATEVLDAVYPDTKEALLKQFLEQADKAKYVPVNKRVEIFKIFGIQLDGFMSGKTFAELQAESNGQAVDTANQGKMNAGNALKLKEKDLTLGNSTVE